MNWRKVVVEFSLQRFNYAVCGFFRYITGQIARVPQIFGQDLYRQLQCDLIESELPSPTCSDCARVLLRLALEIEAASLLLLRLCSHAAPLALRIGCLLRGQASVTIARSLDGVIGSPS